jgi:hypothetical protein
VVHTVAYISQLLVSNFNEMRNKRPTRDDKVPVDVPKMLGEYGRRIMTQLINDIFEI